MRVFPLRQRVASSPDLFSDVQSDLSLFLLVFCAIMVVRYVALAIGKVRQTQAAV